MKSREERTKQARENRERNKKIAADAKARGGYVCVAKMMLKVISKVKSKANDRHRASEWQKNNKKRVNTKNRAWAHANPEKVASKQKRYKEDNAPEIRARERRKYHSDPTFRVRSCVRARLRHFMKRVGIPKKERTFSLVGCTPSLLRRHLLQQLPEGVTSLKGYHIDHIFPLSRYSPSELWKMTHWSNLQPLLASHNNSKHANWPTVHEASKVFVQYWPYGAADYYD
jgi:hypothetical protein